MPGEDLKKILIFAAHPDDAELGMGATIALLTKRGHEVLVVDITDGEPTPCGDQDTRKKESAAAAQILEFRRITLTYENRQLSYSDDKRSALAAIIRDYRPDTVFCHLPADSHPDHEAASVLARSAVFAARLTKSDIPGEPFRVRKLHYYYAVHLRRVFSPEFFINIPDEVYRLKKESLKCYRSQFVDNKKNTSVLEYVESRDRYWGFVAGAPFAEGFKASAAIGIDTPEAVL